MVGRPLLNSIGFHSSGKYLGPAEISDDQRSALFLADRLAAYYSGDLE